MKKRYFLFILTVTAMACKKPYNPPIVAGNTSYRVVEGVINSGADPTKIKLSRTVNISSKISANPVTGASFTVESDQNAVYPLAETAVCTYMR